MTKKVHNLHYLKNLRNNFTSPEANLWKALQRNRSKEENSGDNIALNNYIVDFYFPEEKLIIELDGRIHQDVQVY